nr:MAG TPA_asm: hypothetical protein [Caudoviricetes sp.]
MFSMFISSWALALSRKNRALDRARFSRCLTAQDYVSTHGARIEAHQVRTPSVPDEITIAHTAAVVKGTPRRMQAESGQFDCPDFLYHKGRRKVVKCLIALSPAALRIAWPGTSLLLTPTIWTGWRST